MKNYKERGDLPECEKRIKEILKLAEDFTVDQAGILHRIYIPNPRRTPQILHEQLVIPSNMVREILRQVHDIDYSGGHSGTKKTYLKMVPHVFLKTCTL